MQAKSLLLTTLLIAYWAAPLGAAEWRGGGGGWSAGPGGPGPGRPGPGGPGDGRRHGGPDVFVQPYIDLDLSRQSRPNVDAPEFIMAEIAYRPQLEVCDICVDTTGAALWTTPEVATMLHSGDSVKNHLANR